MFPKRFLQALVVLLSPTIGMNHVLAQISADSLSKINVINTAVPFLRIAPDARSGAMGDAGLALSPDANAIFWNSAKIPFGENNFAAAVTYTPWLRAIVNDIYLAALSGYYKVDDNQAIQFGLRYFSLGTITFTDEAGNVLNDFNPREFSVNAGYSRKITDYMGLGINLGFIYSNLAAGYAVNNVPIKAGKAVAADLSWFFHHPASFGQTRGNYNIAVSISNIGNKMSYTSDAAQKDFLPTNLGIGGRLNFQFDDYNSLAIDLDFNKLLVPTPDDSGKYLTESPIEGMFKSFADAPGGFKEELQEITIGSGLEYNYKDVLFVRGGYFHENQNKGGRQYITAGFGIKYNVFGLNFSYLIPTTGNKSPLDNTLRFTLLFNFNQGNTNQQNIDETVDE